MRTALRNPNPGASLILMRLADLLLVGEWVEPETVASLVILVRPPLAVRTDLSVLLLKLPEVNVVRKMLKVSTPHDLFVLLQYL